VVDRCWPNALRPLGRKESALGGSRAARGIRHWRPPRRTIDELAAPVALQSITPAANAGAVGTPDATRPAAAVLSHAGVIQTLIKQVRGEPLHRFGGMKLDFGSVTLLEHADGQWRVVRENG
jgi:hypothetical protein